MSNFYKTINVDNIKDIQQEIIRIFPNEYYGKGELFSIIDSGKILLGLPKLRKLLDYLNLSIGINEFEFIVMQPNDKTGIHTDSSDFEYSFNIPLTDCDETYLSFYKSKITTDKEYVSYENPTNKDTIHYKPYNYDECEFVESAIIRSPYIFNTDILHNLENRSNKEQIVALIRISHIANNTVKNLLTK